MCSHAQYKILKRKRTNEREQCHISVSGKCFRCLTGNPYFTLERSAFRPRSNHQTDQTLLHIKEIKAYSCRETIRYSKTIRLNGLPPFFRMYFDWMPRFLIKQLNYSYHSYSLGSITCYEMLPIVLNYKFCIRQFPH